MGAAAKIPGLTEEERLELAALTAPVCRREDDAAVKAKRRRVHVVKADDPTWTPIGDADGADVLRGLVKIQELEHAVTDGTRPKTVICELCRKPVAAPRSGSLKRFCSERCRHGNAGPRQMSATCEECNALFSLGPKGRVPRFCSSRCRTSTECLTDGCSVRVKRHPAMKGYCVKCANIRRRVSDADERRKARNRDRWLKSHPPESRTDRRSARARATWRTRAITEGHTSRHVEAARMRADGMALKDIAESLGYANESSAYGAVAKGQRLLAARRRPPA